MTLPWPQPLKYLKTYKHAAAKDGGVISYKIEEFKLTDPAPAPQFVPETTIERFWKVAEEMSKYTLVPSVMQSILVAHLTQFPNDKKAFTFIASAALAGGVVWAIYTVGAGSMQTAVVALIAGVILRETWDSN